MCMTLALLSEHSSHFSFFCSGVLCNSGRSNGGVIWLEDVVKKVADSDLSVFLLMDGI
jgi:hypothetical protein